MKISEANRLRILYFLVFCCTAAWLPIFADYLKGHGLTGIGIGLILAITPVLMFLVQPFYGMLADRLGYKKTLLFSSFLKTPVRKRNYPMAILTIYQKLCHTTH